MNERTLSKHLIQQQQNSKHKERRDQGIKGCCLQQRQQRRREQKYTSMILVKNTFESSNKYIWRLVNNIVSNINWWRNSLLRWLFVCRRRACQANEKSNCPPGLCLSSKSSGIFWYYDSQPISGYLKLNKTLRGPSHFSQPASNATSHFNDLNRRTTIFYCCLVGLVSCAWTSRCSNLCGKSLFSHFGNCFCNFACRRIAAQ